MELLLLGASPLVGFKVIEGTSMYLEEEGVSRPMLSCPGLTCLLCLSRMFGLEKILTGDISAATV